MKNCTCRIDESLTLLKIYMFVTCFKTLHIIGGGFRTLRSIPFHIFTPLKAKENLKHSVLDHKRLR